jgi:hypothetical protein
VDRRALEAAKKQGKEAYALEKAHIAKEKELADAEKNNTKLKATATKQAEKARLAAEKKAEKAQLSAEKKAAKYHTKVCVERVYFLYSSTLQATNNAMEPLPSNTQPEPLPAFAAPEVPHTTDAGDDGEEELKFGLHPDNPANFLKLSGALWIFMQHTLSDADINAADTLIRQYVTELLKVRLAINLSYGMPLNLHSISSFMVRMLSNQTITTRHILQILCATSGHFTISGLFFSSASIKYSSLSRPTTTEMENLRRLFSLSFTECVSQVDW